MNGELEEVRVNIVEQPGWKPWESGGPLAELSSQAAWEEWRFLSREDLVGLLDEMIGETLKGPKEWKPGGFVITNDEWDRMATELREGTLDVAQTAILDALTWSWEQAYSPDDGDAEIALDQAKKKIVKKYILDETLWGPIIDRWDEEKILESLMANVSYTRQTGWYDRFLEFDFGNAEAVKKLLKVVYADPEKLSEKETFHWLNNEFADLQKWVLDYFFDELDKIMAKSDPSNRTDFKGQWKEILKDKDRMRHVRREISEFLKEARRA